LNFAVVALIEIRKRLRDALKSHADMLKNLHGMFTRISVWRKQRDAHLGTDSDIAGDAFDSAASEAIGAFMNAAKEAGTRAQLEYTSLIAQFPNMKNNQVRFELRFELSCGAAGHKCACAGRVRSVPEGHARNCNSQRRAG
jgi:hypothetical protein